MTLGHTSTKKDSIFDIMMPNTFSIFQKFTKEESYLLKYIKGKCYIYANFKEGDFSISNTNSINFSSRKNCLEKISLSFTRKNQTFSDLVGDVEKEGKNLKKKIQANGGELGNRPQFFFQIFQNYGEDNYWKINKDNPQKICEKVKISLDFKNYKKSKLACKIDEKTNMKSDDNNSLSLKNTTRLEFSGYGAQIERSFFLMGPGITTFNSYFKEKFEKKSKKNKSKSKLKYKNLKIDLSFTGFYSWKKRSRMGRGWKIKGTLSHKFPYITTEFKA